MEIRTFVGLFRCILLCYARQTLIASRRSRSVAKQQSLSPFEANSFVLFTADLQTRTRVRVRGLITGPGPECEF